MTIQRGSLPKKNFYNCYCSSLFSDNEIENINQWFLTHLHRIYYITMYRDLELY